MFPKSKLFLVAFYFTILKMPFLALVLGHVFRTRWWDGFLGTAQLQTEIFLRKITLQKKSAVAAPM